MVFLTDKGWAVEAVAARHSSVGADLDVTGEKRGR